MGACFEALQVKMERWAAVAGARGGSGAGGAGCCRARSGFCLAPKWAPAPEGGGLGLSSEEQVPSSGQDGQALERDGFPVLDFPTSMLV